MLKNEKKRIQILSLLRTMPVVSTEQISRFFNETNHPTKRASEILKELEDEKIIEGRRRYSKSKVWRLSKKGRELCEYLKRPIPLNSRKIEHILAIGDVFLDLQEGNSFKEFVYEFREQFKDSKGFSRIYSPDAFIVLKNDYSFFLEVQRTHMYPNQWKEKWKMAREYFVDKNIKQDIFVLTNQSFNSITKGAEDLTIFKITDIKELM